MDFIKELHEARMTSDNGSSKQLTYTDCGERMYLMLLAFETMRKYPNFQFFIEKYCTKTAGFESYRAFRFMGTDLYNFLYFLVGDDEAQDKLKDPDAAKAMKQRVRIPIVAINKYISALAKRGKEPELVTKMFIDIESALNITNADYKSIRRGLHDYDTLNLNERKKLVTRLKFAVRAKLRSSDIIDEFEKFTMFKDLGSVDAVDPEPTISTPDITTSPADMAMYRYIVGANNIAQTKRFLEQAKNGKAVSADMLRAYMPAIKLLDDIVKAGPAYVQNLKALHDRAKKRN